MEGFEYISHLMVRFKVIEATHIEIRAGDKGARQVFTLVFWATRLD